MDSDFRYIPPPEIKIDPIIPLMPIIELPKIDPIIKIEKEPEYFLIFDPSVKVYRPFLKSIYD
ncbi:hypothetical protein HYU07_05045 [Candidatus Woesearchaeota archaeon]|nr:hypothetical protein [Candidatus Woesearchaeota archaeon]